MVGRIVSGGRGFSGTPQREIIELRPQPVFWVLGLVPLLVSVSVFAQSAADVDATKRHAAPGKSPPKTGAENTPTAEDNPRANGDTEGKAAPADTAAKATGFSRASIGAPSEPLPTAGTEPPGSVQVGVEAAGAENGSFWQRHRSRPGEIEIGYFLGLLSPSSRNNFHRQTLPQQDIGTGFFFGTRIGYFPIEFA